MRLLLANCESRDGRLLPLIFTGTVVAREALRKDAHRFAGSGLDPLRHPRCFRCHVFDAAACRSYPASAFAPLSNEASSWGATPRPTGLSPVEIRDAHYIQSACAARAISVWRATPIFFDFREPDDPSLPCRPPSTHTTK
jgi:hypothetical protein